MKSWVKICLQTAWLSTAISILVMGTSLCIATDEACFQSGDSMMFLMFWLTFPCGVLFLVASEIFLDGGGTHFPSDFITVWMILMCGGLVQWFVLVPRLFEKRKFVTLDLAATAPASSPDSIKTAPEKTQSSFARKVDFVETRAPDAGSADVLVRNPAGNGPQNFKEDHEAKFALRAQCGRGRPRSQRSRSRPTNDSFAPFDRKGRTPLERVIGHS